MARSLHKLTDRQVKTMSRPGRHGDGGGLYLQVEKSKDEKPGSRSWVFMWKAGGKRTAMGLGGYPALSLAMAREKASAARKGVAAGGNPLAESRKEQEPTFAEAVDMFLADRERGWRNEKHRAQWRMTLGDAYCRHLRPMRVSGIGTEDVLKVLKPHWQTKPETASRLRGRVERVLSFAKVKSWRSGENPALWRGHLDALLPAPKKLAARGHHRAMPFGEVPALVGELRQREAMAARALEFLILTAARSGEALGARWSEIDFDAAVWTVPAQRMKAGKMHVVPLVPRVVDILRHLSEVKQNDFVFPGQRSNRPVSAEAIVNLLTRMRALERTTVHGFRAAFKTWATEATAFPRELVEMAMAHNVGSAVERAYQRGSAVERRWKLMEAWANFVSRGGSNLLPFRRAPSAAEQEGATK